MTGNTPTTPRPTTGCTCMEQCTCCYAPVRISRFALINRDEGGTKLFSDEKKPGTFPYFENKHTPSSFLDTAE